jgi:very-short-patch-repair endonuclease
LLVAGQIRGNAWRRLFPDVYIAADVELDHRLWCEAALLYVDDDQASISGLSAAFLLGVDLLPITGWSVTLTVPPSRRPGRGAVTGLTIIRAALARTDVGSGRLRATTPIRTAFDVARLLPFGQAVAAIDAMAHRRLIDLAELRAYALAAGGCRGVRQIGRVLSEADPQAESPMETALRLVLVDGGLPRPETQVEIYSESGMFIGRADLAYRRVRVALEYEGDHHRDRATFRRDITRVNAMREANRTVVRVTADDLRHPDRLIRQVRKLLDEHDRVEWTLSVAKTRLGQQSLSTRRDLV